MSTIGAFHQQADGSYAGAIKTLVLNIKAVQLRAADKENDKAPDFRIYAGATEIGAAWKRTSRDDRGYLSVKLDDPSFPAPVFANMVEAEDGYSLIWSRNRPAADRNPE